MISLVHVLTLQVGGKITIAENKCRQTVYVLVPVGDRRTDPVCEIVDSFSNDATANINGACETPPNNCVDITGGSGTTNVVEATMAYLRIENDLNVGTIECDTLVIEQWDTGSTSGTKKGYYYDDKPFDTYHKSW